MSTQYFSSVLPYDSAVLLFCQIFIIRECQNNMQYTADFCQILTVKYLKLNAVNLDINSNCINVII